MFCLGVKSFWVQRLFTVCSSIPVHRGSLPKRFLLGGPAVDNATLKRFFSLHYLAALVIAGLVIVPHLAFHTTGTTPHSCRSPSAPARRTAKKDTLADFCPTSLMKDLFALAVILVVFFRSVGSCRTIWATPINYIRGKPAFDACDIVPEMVLLARSTRILRAFTAEVWSFKLRPS